MDFDVNVSNESIRFRLLQTPRCAREVRRLRSEIEQAAAAGHLNMVIDLSQVSWIGTAVAGALALSVRLTAPQGGSVTVVGQTASAERVLHLTGLDAFLRGPEEVGYATCPGVCETPEFDNCQVCFSQGAVEMLHPFPLSRAQDDEFDFA